ncbi:paired amphipathic helix protein Sin3-like 3 [Artemisia annua]|uniref:Paired amphipathic helix protein Sin3-like 3 n=1 Tax=Artemisia annua TaxID=35608 RepID=A0A2U1PDT4_ARTAN|nr:paired amphipathic helix protein Sin3-like 3 [Artemisia annua]
MSVVIQYWIRILQTAEKELWTIRRPSRKDTRCYMTDYYLLNSIRYLLKQDRELLPAHSDLYSIFMNSLYNLLDGVADSSKFKDDCRDILEFSIKFFMFPSL